MGSFKGEEIGAAVLELLSKFEEIEEEEDEPLGMEGAVMEALKKSLLTMLI